MGVFKHKLVGPVITQAEYENNDSHEASGQTTNDMTYFDGSNWINATIATIRSLLNITSGADVTGDNAPQAHKASHQNGGGDEVSVTGLSGLLADDQHVLDSEVVTATKTVKLDDLTAPDDNTDLDFSTSKHGLVPKGTNIGNFLKDDGTWSSAAGGSGTVDTSGVPVTNDFARFKDADTIEGRSYAEVKADLSLEAADIATLVATTKLDDLATPDDNTDLDASTSKHGLVPKGTNVGNYLKDDLTWAAGVGGGDVSVSGTPSDGKVAIWTGAAAIEGANITFGATIMVAASDALGAEKVGAVASGGTVCA